MKNVLEKMGYSIEDTRKINLDMIRCVVKHKTKGWLIIEVDESEVSGILDLTYKEKEYEIQIKPQIKKKHFKTYSDIRKYL